MAVLCKVLRGHDADEHGIHDMLCGETKDASNPL